VARSERLSAPGDLRARVEEQIRRHDLIPSGGEVLALVSGGPDSSCLWHALRELGYRVSALHVNHGLRGAESDEDARFCREAFGAEVVEAPPPARPTEDALRELREKVDRLSEALGRRLKILVGKPGLDGHSNGAEQIAVRARDAGMDVVYEGIRLMPSRIAATAVQEGVHVVGLSILSGSHRELIPTVVQTLRDRGVDAPVVVGGIIPEADVEPLKAAGVAAEDWFAVTLGTIVAAVVSFAAVRWFLRYVQTHTFEGFGWYRVGLGSLFLVLAR